MVMFHVQNAQEIVLIVRQQTQELYATPALMVFTKIQKENVFNASIHVQHVILKQFVNLVLKDTY